MKWTIIQQADGSWAVVDDAGTVVVPGQETRELAVDRLRELATSALGELPEGGIASGRGARFRARFQEGERTSDGRIIDPNATNFNRPPPLPWMLTTETSDGHLGAQLSGVIDTTRREGTTVVLEGNFDAGSDAGQENERLVREGIMTTWSPDIGDAEIRMEVLEDPEGAGEEEDILGLLLGLGDTLMHLTSGTILGGTAVPFPALGSARVEALAASIEGGGFPYVRSTGTIELVEEADGSPIVAAAEPAEVPCVECGQTEPEGGAATEDFASSHPAYSGDHSHEHPAMGTQGSDETHSHPHSHDGDASHDHEHEHEMAAGGLVAAKPYVVGEQPPEEVQVPAGSGVHVHVSADPKVAAARVAAALTDDPLAAFRPPPDWFEDPQLDGPTPMTVTPEGRVYGHLAQWGVCHTGIMDRCVMAPRSRSEYAYFMQGSVRCADGTTQRCGHITVGSIGHADLAADPSKAKAHYDGGPGAFVAAHVAVGEDRHGVWFAGAVDPRLDDFQRWELETLAISGDWRSLGGHLELIAALSVPVPGFPILASGEVVDVGVPRPDLLLSRGEVVSIVAAGTLAPRRVALAQEVVSLRQSHQQLEDRVNELEIRLDSRTEPLLASAAERLRARLRGE